MTVEDRERPPAPDTQCDRCGVPTRRPPDHTGRRLCLRHAYPAGIEEEDLWDH